MDLRKLRPDDPLFREYLKNIETKLIPDQMIHLFDILIGHLNSGVETKIAREIYLALEKSISHMRYLRIFIDEGFLLRLPFEIKSHFEMILSICLCIVKRDPNAFNSDFAVKFARMIRYKGKKCLIILSLFSQHVSNVTNPWPMLDLLFDGEERFTAIDVVCEYVSLLSLLCQSFADFRNARAVNCWKIISGLLDTEDVPETLNSCWNALTRLASLGISKGVNFATVKAQFADEALRAPIISYLLVAQTLNVDADVEFIGQLLRCAKKDVKASLVIMKIAKIQEVSELLIQDSSWMGVPLPSPVDTLRIFLVVYSHESCREALTESPEVVDMLKMLNGIDAPQMTTLLGVVIRNLKLDADMMVSLSESGFFAEYFKRSNNLRHVLIMGDTIIRTCYVDDLLEFCELLVDVLRNGGDEFDTACQVGMNMCTRKRLRRKIRELNISSVLEKYPDSVLAKQFLERI